MMGTRSIDELVVIYEYELTNNKQVQVIVFTLHSPHVTGHVK
jgi:hypothetical protein